MKKQQQSEKNYDKEKSNIDRRKNLILTKKNCQLSHTLRSTTAAFEGQTPFCEITALCFPKIATKFVVCAKVIIVVITKSFIHFVALKEQRQEVSRWTCFVTFFSLSLSSLNPKMCLVHQFGC